MNILKTVIDSTTFVLITLQLNPNFVPMLTNFVISSLCTKVWNNLPHDLVSAPDIAIFRKPLKNFNLCSIASLTF